MVAETVATFAWFLQVGWAIVLPGEPSDERRRGPAPLPRAMAFVFIVLIIMVVVSRPAVRPAGSVRR